MGTERDPLKVATFNINNINKRLDNLLAWLAKVEPDVVSLQELKAEQGAFPVKALRTLDCEVKIFLDAWSDATPPCAQLFHSSLVISDLASKIESAEYIKGGNAGDCPRA
jgi:hypothetical protein